MKRKRFTEEQIIGILRQGDAGRKPDDLAHKHGMSVGTFYALKAKFGGMIINSAQRLRTLKDENRRLKSLVADLSLNVRMLQSVAEKQLATSKKRSEVDRFGQEFAASERRSYRLLELPRCTQCYRSQGIDQSLLREKLRACVYAAPRNGYGRIWDALRTKYLALGLRRFYRL